MPPRDDRSYLFQRVDAAMTDIVEALFDRGEYSRVIIFGNRDFEGEVEKYFTHIFVLAPFRRGLCGQLRCIVLRVR